MTQNQVNELVEEYRRCRRLSKHLGLPKEKTTYYFGRCEAIKFSLEVVGVYVKEVALLL